MILAKRSSAKNVFVWLGKQAGASIPTCSTENGGAKFGKKNWQRIGNQINAAFVAARGAFRKVLAAGLDARLLRLF